MSGFETSKKALPSEIYQTAREGMRTKREIKHFSEEAGNDYGPEWGAVVNEYLKTAYKEVDKGCDLEVASSVYKVLRQDKVTAFYDSNGDTLFDVTNKQLEKEYKFWKKDNNLSEEEESVLEEQTENTENNLPVSEENKEPEGREGISEKAAGMEKTDLVPEEVSKSIPDVKERAKKKLEDELKNAKDQSFADPVIKHLLRRCEEEKGLSEDVLQKHKTWEKCFDYIYKQARKQASGNRAAVRDEVVYEWAEDYYHKDDKAEEAEKARKAAEAKKKAAERAAKSKASTSKSQTEKKAAQQKQEAPVLAEKTEEKRTRRNSKDLEGQMNMFSMMGM